ncbi:MAG: DinB family protein [Rectinemataceae bacterium]
MKEILEALAKYKRNVDESLLGTVEKLGEDKLLAATGTFFPNVFAQLKHIFGSDINWIKRLKAAFPKSAALAGSRFADYDADSLKTLPAGDRARVFAGIRELDRDVAAFVAELDDKSLASAVTYKNYQGQNETHELWKVLIHWFNHGVHHRGTISGQLDSLGVENDYSALLPKI